MIQSQFNAAVYADIRYGLSDMVVCHGSESQCVWYFNIRFRPVLVFLCSWKSGKDLIFMSTSSFFFAHAAVPVVKVKKLVWSAASKKLLEKKLKNHSVKMLHVMLSYGEVTWILALKISNRSRSFVYTSSKSVIKFINLARGQSKCRTDLVSGLDAPLFSCVGPITAFYCQYGKRIVYENICKHWSDFEEAVLSRLASLASYANYIHIYAWGLTDLWGECRGKLEGTCLRCVAAPAHKY